MSRKVLSDLDFGGAVRGINHPDPTNPQDVATRAFVLASVAVTPGTTLGRQVDAVGAAAAIPITGLEQGENFRRDLHYAVTLVPGGGSGSGGEYTEADIALDARVSTFYITPSTAGDVRLRRMAHGAANSGAEVMIVKEGTPGRVILVDSNDGGFSFWTPGSVDYALTRYNDAVEVGHRSGRWKLKSRQLTALNPGEMLGNPITAAGVAGAGAVTALQQGDSIRLGTVQIISVAPGNNPGWVVPRGVKTILITVTSPGDVNIQGLTCTDGNAGAFLDIIKATAVGRIVLMNQDGTASSANQINTPAAVPFYLIDANDGANVKYVGGAVLKFQVVDRNGAALATIRTLVSYRL